MENKKRKMQKLGRLRSQRFRQNRHNLSSQSTSPMHDASSIEELNILDVAAGSSKDQVDQIEQEEIAMDIAENENKLSGNNENLDITSNLNNFVTSYSLSDGEPEDDEYERTEISETDDEIDLVEASMDEEEFSEVDDEINEGNDFESTEIEKLQNWALSGNPTIPHTKLNELLAILRVRLLPNLPKNSKTFLKTASVKYNIQVNEDSSEYVYFGIKEQLQAIINSNFHTNNVIELVINVDGLQLFKSSSKQFWPILCKVFSEQDIYKPFPVAIYSGNHKPTNLEKYLHKFIHEMDQLHETGLEINGQKFHITIKAFVCDRPARAFLKNIKSHGGYWACERCTVYGERIENRTIYPIFGDDVEERTDESFRNQSNPEHHIGISPLLNMKTRIDMIFTFVLDFMHLVYLGIMKKLLLYWIRRKSITQLRNPAKIRLTNLLLKLQSQVPSEFQRTTRSLTDVEKFKATELKFLLLYSGPVILKQILSKNLYNNFLLLSTACRILCSKELAVKYWEHAKLFLITFVTSASNIYGRKSLIYNMHSLIHLADDVRFMKCPLSLLTAFPFENALGTIKKFLRSGNRPLAQIVRRLHESFFMNAKTATLLPRIEILRKLRPNGRGQTPVKRVKYKNSVLTTKAPNNTVLLKTGIVLQINNINLPPNGHKNDIEISGFILDKEKSLFTYPCDSTEMKMWVVRRNSRVVFTCSLNDVSQKMVTFDLSTTEKEKIYTMPLLHM